MRYINVRLLLLLLLQKFQMDVHEILRVDRLKAWNKLITI